MIQAIVFDAYGTLISTGDGSVRAAKKILELNGSAISPADFYADWKQYHRKHIDELSEFRTEADIFHMDLQALYEKYHLNRDAHQDVAIMLDTLGRRKPFPETRDAIEALKRDFLVCIGSTTDTAPLLADLHRGELTVDRIFTSEQLRAYKPRRVFYEKIAQTLGLPAQQILFVGDSLLDDVWGPGEIGMKTCWVNRKNQTVHRAAPDLIVQNLTQIQAGIAAL